MNTNEKVKQAMYEEWLKSRPPAVRALAEKYPPGTAFLIHGQPMYVFSYGEYKDGTTGIFVTPVWPGEDYEQAMEQRQPICACCLDKLEELKQ